MKVCPATWSLDIDTNGSLIASNGKYTKVAYFESKAKVDARIRELGVPATFFIAGFYMSTITEWIQQIPSSDRKVSLVLGTNAAPKTTFPLIDAAADTGKFVKAILLNREKTLGRYVLGAVGCYTLGETMTEIGEVLEERISEAKYVKLSEQEHKANMAKLGMDADLQEGSVQTFKSAEENGYFGAEGELLWSHSVSPRTKICGWTLI